MSQAAHSKIVIIGVGQVGATFAFALMPTGLAREIVLIDLNRQRAEGEAMDLNHGLSLAKPVSIYAGTYADCKDADIMVITAGANQKKGETRIDLLQRNVAVFRSIIEAIKPYFHEHTILLPVTNPVDILSYVTYQLSGLPFQRVIGSGTVLDSSRLRYLISEHCRVNARNVHAYIIGEHGDSELAMWSHADIGGVNVKQYCDGCTLNHCCENKEMEFQKIFEEVKNAAYKIIAAKGATYYAIALSLVAIVEAILRDENGVLPVSTLIHDYHEIEEVYLSMPSIVNRHGVRQFLKLALSSDEALQLKNSAKKLKEILKAIGF